MERRLVFLLGSGVSRRAEMPSVDEITKIVLDGARDGRRYRKHTDGCYYCSSEVPDASNGALDQILEFLGEIQRLCNGYFRREISYEDIAYLVWQVNEQQSGNYENPALVPLIRRFRRRLHVTDLGELANESNTYIHCLVRDMLSKSPTSLGNMPCLIDACRTNRLDHVDVFTLNHDTVLERELAFAGVEFTDGFERKTDTCDYWDTRAFTCAIRNVRIGKLHGSVDWHLYRPDPANPTRLMVGRPNKVDFQHTHNLSGKLQWPIGIESVLLIGSFNKVLEYTGGIFADLFCAFRSALRETDHLIVGGYGFRDKGVNQSIIEWLRAAPEKKLVIVHEDYQIYARSGRKAIRDLFRRNSSQIFGTGTWFQDASFTDLQADGP